MQPGCSLNEPWMGLGCHSQRYIKGISRTCPEPGACSPQVSSLDEPLAGAQEDRVYDRVRQSKNLVGAGRAILDRPQNFPFDRNTKLAMEGWTWTSTFGCFANTFVYGSLPSERGLKNIIVHQSKTSLSLQVQYSSTVFAEWCLAKTLGRPGMQAHPTKIEIPNDSFLNEQTEAQGRLAQVRSVSFSKVVTV